MAEIQNDTVSGDVPQTERETVLTILANLIVDNDCEVKDSREFHAAFTAVADQMPPGESLEKLRYYCGEILELCMGGRILQTMLVREHMKELRKCWQMDAGPEPVSMKGVQDE